MPRTTLAPLDRGGRPPAPRGARSRTQGFRARTARRGAHTGARGLRPCRRADRLGSERARPRIRAADVRRGGVVRAAGGLACRGVSREHTRARPRPGAAARCACARAQGVGAARRGRAVSGHRAGAAHARPNASDDRHRRRDSAAPPVFEPAVAMREHCARRCGTHPWLLDAMRPSPTARRRRKEDGNGREIVCPGTAQGGASPAPGGARSNRKC